MPTIVGEKADKVKIVYDENLSVRNGKPLNQQRLGVGEEVTLRFIGDGQWSIRIGAPHGALSSQGMQPGSVKFKAPDVPGAAQTSCTVTIDLKQGVKTLASVTFEVVRPSGGRLVMKREIHKKDDTKGDQDPPNRPNAGFLGQMYLIPNDVSFMNVQFREGDGLNTADDPGAFSNYNGTHHAFNDGTRPEHWANPEGVDLTGTRFKAYDTVFSAADVWGGATKTGTTRCPIKWHYRLIGDNTPTGKVLGEIEHKAVVDATGELTISKGGVTVKKKLSDEKNADWP